MDSFILLIIMGWIPAAERSLEQAARSCLHLRFLLKSVWGDCQSMRAHPALDPVSQPWIFGKVESLELAGTQLDLGEQKR